MHDGAVVVLDKVHRVVDLVILRPIATLNVLPVDLDRLVTVFPHLLVPHSQRVSDLVHRNPELRATDKRSNERRKIATMTVFRNSGGTL